MKKIILFFVFVKFVKPQSKCLAGSWGATGSTVCTGCAAGLYSTVSGATSLAQLNCLSCPNGLYSAVGSSSCNGCVPNTNSAISGSTPLTDVPGFLIHSYKTVGTYSITFTRNVIADVLLVGGGGGGGKNCGGGGGAGAVVFHRQYLFSSSKTYSVTIGSGGADSTVETASYSGGDTYISENGVNLFFADGGGAGGVLGVDGANGGSGGGGGGMCGGRTVATYAGNALTNVIQSITGFTRGFAGGRGYYTASGSCGQAASGGGGGAGQAGTTGISDNSGVGGNGICYATGTSTPLEILLGSAYSSVAVYYATDTNMYIAGGGGGGGNAGCGQKAGGLGGGGAGYNCGSGTSTATSGKANTGSGGGGGGANAVGNGKSGGSGMILLRYSTCQPCNSGTVLINAGLSGSCLACAANTYQWWGGSGCTNCPANSASPVSSSVCNGLRGYYISLSNPVATVTTTASVTVNIPNIVSFTAINQFWGIVGSVYFQVASGGMIFSPPIGPSQVDTTTSTKIVSSFMTTCSTTCTSPLLGHCSPTGSTVCCGAGYSFKDSVDTACQACSSGSYASTGAETICTGCEAGKYESGTTKSTCTLCAAGKYSTGRGMTVSSTCVNCVAGKYLTGSGLAVSTACVSCGAGTYSTGIGITTSSACLPCEAGKYSTGTGISVSSSCLSCSAGKYSTGTGITTSSLCLSCDAGKYSSGTGITTSSLCLSCDAGKYSSGTGITTSSSCLSCGAGKFSSGTGITTSTMCNTCEVGTYSAAGALACTPCTNQPLNSYYIGYSTANNCPWACNSGYYLNSSCLSCPPNFWCSGNVLNSCPTNSMSNQLSTVQNDCMCSPGYFGDGSVTGTSPCPICTAGNWCPGGNLNTSNACPENFTSDTGSSSVSDCFCLPGYQMLNSLCVLCPSNTFCFSGILNACPNNSFSPSGSSLLSSCVCNDGFFKNMDQCEECPVNFYCSLNNKTQCVENAVSPVQSINSSACYCKRGYSGINNEPCEICPSDTWCWTGVVNNCPLNSSSPPMSNYWYNCTCNQGFTGENGQACAPCTEGTYKDVPGSSVCLPCPLGMICPQASINPIPCPLGCFCDGISFYQCPPDNYCPPNSEWPIKCPENSNSKNMSTNLSDCKANDGFYSLPPILCEIDYFCQNSTYFPCSTCDQVTLKSCDRQGLSQDITVCGCETGYYNPQSCEKCPPYTTSPQNNTNTSIKSCRCMEGYFCTYSKRIFCSVVINTPLSQFDAEEFKASVAFAANVTVDKVFIISVTSHVRSLKLNLPTIRVTMFIEAQHISFDKLREHRQNKFKIAEFKWEQQDFIQTSLQ